MKERIEESGKASLWDFLIVIMVVCILYLGYARGLADHFLAPQYQSTTLLGRKAAPDDDNAPVTRPGSAPNEVASSWGTPGGSRGGDSLKIEPVPGTESEAATEETAPAATTAQTSRFADSEDEEEEGGFVNRPSQSAQGSDHGDDLPLPTRNAPDAYSSSPTAAETPSKPEAVQLVGLDRRYWPQQVRLLKPMVFPVVFNGQEVGSASLPVGATVTLASISSEEKIVVQNGQASLEIAVADTDLLDRVRVLQRVTGETAAPTPASAPRSGGWDPRAHNPQQSNY